ncbi:MULTISPECIES: NAD(P)/FAD-dependent oxidoreductase [unclassified Aureimonas]|uniref:NAD(P)/FAD-dependent oxidoreductase n=1 Tax=unclassified Aureimonas TaxID=2615206 RepID=UPI0006FB1553|nr:MULTISPECIES: FAD-binding oxidoreductase [unclassified Aureimonas]KQT69039.1 oxidoreductase [Aureimonas sp. Leaf460]KQT69274.1 oxidoreductase [Aureimonas sp. Leaf427]
MARFSPFDATLWFATAEAAPATRALEGEITADVCIVGAGYTGMTTALELAKAGTDTVLLEAEEAGFGGSGRNAGHCTPTFTHYSLPDLRRMLGEPWAERLIARQTQANTLVAGRIRDYQISCEWVQNGYVMGALHPGALKTVREKTESYNAVGAKTRFIGRDEVETITGSPRFLGGWFHTEAGHLNPLGYARGLARAGLQEGVRLFTRSPVTGVEREGGQWRVRTAGGSVLAEKVIFASGAYTVGGWPKLDRTFRILRVFVGATQPLSEETRRTVLPQNTTIHDGRGDIFVYKYDAAGRIVASMFPMGRRGRDPAYTRQVMTDRLTWLHPQLREEIRWEHLWFGELDMQVKTVPRLYDLAPGVVALTGLSGRGVPTGSMLGSILAEWALDVPARDLSLRLEPLRSAPFYMRFGPQLSLRYHRTLDNLATRLAGKPLPPHA